MDIIQYVKIREITMVIPFVIIGMIFVAEGLIVLLHHFSNKKQWVRYPLVSAMFLVVSGVCWLLLNWTYLIIPIFLWIGLTIVFAIREKKNKGISKYKTGEEELDNKEIAGIEIAGIEIADNEIDRELNRFIPWFRKKTKKRIVGDIVAIVLVFAVILPYLLAGAIYQCVFGIRYDYFGKQSFEVEDFDGLCRDEMTFKSDKGQKLAGYLYYGENVSDQRGVVVIGHGYGCGGHRGYMAVANYFAQNGYYVFAYDTTGTDYSEGEQIYGLPQQIVDMDYAISYVEELSKTKGLPIVLWGHSWGGYTVTNELQYHPEVKAVVSFSGFNYSLDLIEAWGPSYVGPLTYYVIPYMKLHQQLIMGDVAESKAENGFEASQAGVMAITADNDVVVPKQYGYDLWYEKYSDDNRFRFKLLTGFDESRSHSHVFCSKEYIEEIEAFDEGDFKTWLDSLDYDYNDKANEEQFIEDKDAFFDQDYVRKIRTRQVDQVLFDEILAFYDEFIN